MAGSPAWVDGNPFPKLKETLLLSIGMSRKLIKASESKEEI
jgi:hypothetical protein